MILLLLGLAIVLTTSSSLLVANGSGRGGDGDKDSSNPPAKPPNAGEIAGSVSITAAGEVWITVLIDDVSILARLDIVYQDQSSSGYRLSVVAVDSQKGAWGSVSPHFLPFAAHESRAVEFNNPEEAASKIICLFDKMGIVISKDSLRSIPYAIACGWKSPEDCQQIVDEMLDESSKQ